MSIDKDINAPVRRWREGVKRKMRGIASFAERAQLRFDAIRQRIYTHRIGLSEWRLRQARYRAWGDYEYLEDWRTIRVGEHWGGEDITAFFHRSITIPDELAGRMIALQIYVGGDSLVYLDGEPYHGLDLFRNEIPLAESAEAGRVYDVRLESYMQYQSTAPAINEFVVADLVAIDLEIRGVYWDLWCVAKMLEIQTLDRKLGQFLEHRLWEAMKLVPLQSDDPAEFKRQALAAGQQVRQTIYETDRFKGEGLMYLVGHSHLDVVYMWPYKEFLRKVGRTHATALRLMEQYPQFKFSQSQARIYADMKRCYPALFEQVRRRVAEGRWEPIGAFWVEPDCHVISGESFVRQILHGQRFYREEFGMVSRSCWQPDVFGLSWALPQILARSGIRYFLTNKMVPWNDTNPWTLNTFWWEGLDGSRVLAIVPPGHFIGTVDPDLIDMQWRSFADKDTIGQTLHIYGWGDGGGGVDIEMLESAVRYGDFPGLVPMEFATAEEAFDRIAERAEQLPPRKLAVLRDEIYLEAHRGSYTNKGRLKKLNRRSELLYREAEMLAALAWSGGGSYPTEKLDAGWKDVLTAQFHDSVPGTHITQVYHDLLADYERITAAGLAIRAEAMEELTGAPAAGQADADALVVFNSQPYGRDDALSVPGEWCAGKTVTDAAGQTLGQQDVVGLDGAARRLVAAGEVPPMGLRVLKLVEGPPATGGGAVAAGEGALENELLKATFNTDGELTSLWDKVRGREVLPAGQRANQLQMFEDTPGRYDAWDIVQTYVDHPIDISGGGRLAVDETGPLRASLRLERTIGSSRLVQRISLTAGDGRLTFETWIDWVERQRLLKVAFPVEINADFVTCDIAYGNMPRPTRPRNPHEAARFEVPAHQWMDLSQADYGVSLLNDCKYGCDTWGQVMRLTLLKGSIHPDPVADKEQHLFTYALYPHAGDWRQGRTIAAAMSLNSPLLARPARLADVTARDGQSLLSVDAPNLTLEAVKQSEDGRDLIVRLVERHNARTAARLTLGRPVRQAWSCNIIEENEAELPVEGPSVAFTARPHEIVTLRIAL